MRSHISVEFFIHYLSLGQDDKQCRYPSTNNNMSDPVMNYAASLATAAGASAGPAGTNIAAAAHFYQQQVSTHFISSIGMDGSVGHMVIF